MPDKPSVQAPMEKQVPPTFQIRPVAALQALTHIRKLLVSAFLVKLIRDSILVKPFVKTQWIA